MSIKDRTCIVGIGQTDWGRRGQFTDLTANDLVRIAFDRALEDSGLDRRDVDGLSTYSLSSDAGVAADLARALGMETEILRCKSTIKGEEACYVQDTVLRLNDARFGPGDTGRVVENFYDYIIWGPIGRAFRAGKKVVLLLDEIDKTESDVQDNLLDILEECQFTIREINETIKAEIRPAIFITSNAKRELSDPFLRRCYCHHIAFPSPDDMRQIIDLHYPKTNPKLIEAAVNIFYELRERGFEKPPATSPRVRCSRSPHSTKGPRPIPSSRPSSGRNPPAPRNARIVAGRSSAGQSVVQKPQSVPTPTFSMPTISAAWAM